MEREYIRDRTLEGRESARRNGSTIGGAAVTGMLSMALHLRDQDHSLHEIAAPGETISHRDESTVDTA